MSFVRAGRGWVVGCLCAGWLLAGASPARGSTLALDFVGTTQNGFVAELTFGWSFTVNNLISVDRLGFFDDFLIDGAGLQQNHLVSLWTGGGALLASTTITNASTPAASTAASGRWLFNDIAPLLLAPGTYVIGAHNPGSAGCVSCDRFRFLDTATTDAAITFIEALDVPGNAFPNSPIPSRNDGYFGPTFTLTAVPEPATLALLATGLVALGARQRRRTRGGA